MPKRKQGKPDEARFSISEQENVICIAAKNYSGIRWDSVIAMPFIAVADTLPGVPIEGRG
jgi:hypothetical protein